MSKVDDELTRRLRRAERPVDDGGVFEELGARRSHRERIRRIQAGLVALAVLAATATGFSVLTGLFDPEPKGPLATTPFGATGAIVACGDEAGGQLCRIEPSALARGVTSDDLLQLTHLSGEIVTSPAVSPDGSTVVFERHEPGTETNRAETAELWTIGIDGTGLTQITSRGSGYIEPSWSSGGLIVALASDDVSQDMRSADLVILDPSLDTISEVKRIDLPGLSFPSSPQRIPGGKLILFSANVGSRTDLYTVAANGSGLKRITRGRESDYLAPRVSPDGRSIAYWVGSPNGVEIRICSIECVDSRTLLDPDSKPISGDFPVWSPDGNWIAFQVTTGPGTDLHIARIDGSDERVLGGGIGEIAWIPAPTEGTTVTPEPEQSPSPEPEGRGIGLGVRMCGLEVLGGIDWDGTGIDGAAWTGTPVDEDGRCSSPAGVQHVVAVDRDGDGVAEQGSTSTLRTCLLCQPFDTVDLNDDGVLELVVLEEASSTPTYSVYEVNRPGSERSPGVYPIIVAAPGAPAMNLDANQVVRFTAGGDEGFSGSIECEEGGAGAPILRYTWVRGAVDADTELRVDITRLSFGEDGVFHIESVDRFTVPRNPEPTDLKSTEPACGVDFHPAA